MILIRRCLFCFLVLLAIVASNAALALVLSWPLQRWAVGTGLVAVIGGVVAWIMALKISVWAKLVEPLAQFSEIAISADDLEASVVRWSCQLGLKRPPQLGFYVSDEVNAFAVARTRNDALLALSSGLLRELSKEQIEAVIVQRLAFIANGDAATLPLIFGQIFAFTLFPARMLALLLGTALRTAEEETPSDPVETLMIAMLMAVFTPVAAALAYVFLRGAQRRADALAVGLVGHEIMGATLAQLAKTENRNESRDKFTVPMKILNSRVTSRLARIVA